MKKYSNSNVKNIEASRKLMNRNFRVKCGRVLVGFSGLVSRIGLDRALLFISKALRSIVDCKRFKVQGIGYVSFYVK